MNSTVNMLYFNPKIVYLGTLDGESFGRKRPVPVFCKIEYTRIAKGRYHLSITGVEGPLANGDCIGSCGQIAMHLNADDITPAPGWTRELIIEFLQTWKRWHANNMRTGTPRQRSWIEAHREELVAVTNHYQVIRQGLTAVGLNPDRQYTPEGERCHGLDPIGYRYGSSWLYEPVPESVLAFLNDLPETDREPAWT